MLFPGGILPLKIFEQRYLSLVKDCMKNNHGFVVVLISKGKEVGESAEIYQIGTYAEITDWESLDNGLLGIKAQGIQTVRILDTTARDDGLLAGHTLDHGDPDIIKARIGDQHINLINTLQEFSRHPFVSQRYPAIDYTSAYDVGYRLCELLPVSNTVRQELLEIRDIDLLLARLETIIDKLGS